MSPSTPLCVPPRARGGRRRGRTSAGRGGARGAAARSAHALPSRPPTPSSNVAARRERRRRCRPRSSAWTRRGGRLGCSAVARVAVSGCERGAPERRPSPSSCPATSGACCSRSAIAASTDVSPGKAGRAERGDDEHAERDADHRDEQTRAQPSPRRAHEPAGFPDSMPVADAADGRDRHRVAELLAHLRDVDVDGARVAEPVVTPDAVEDLLAREREPGPLGEEAEQVELLGGDVDDADRRRAPLGARRRS